MTTRHGTLALIVATFASSVAQAQSTIAVERIDYDMQRVASAPALSADQLRGRELFAQYCSLCHDRIGSLASNPYGPELSATLMNSLGSDLAGRFILQGTDRMPGFQYLLSAKQVEQIVAFLTAESPGVTNIARAAAAARTEADSVVQGSVRAAGGKAIAGVAVSARARNSTISTTVYTDAKGHYRFPTLPSGAYSVWAQAVGYETAHADVALAAKRPAQLTLHLTKWQDDSRLLPQLSGMEWLASLPAQTPQDRRMKEVFRLNCTECHQANVPLERRFDEKGWLTIIRFMAHVDYPGWTGGGTLPGSEQSLFGNAIEYYAADLAKYLARVRGPDSPPLQPKLLPRPTGAAAKVIITAYDVPPAATPNELAWHDGSDWSKGAASGMHGAIGLHDVIVDDQGNAWATHSVANDARTLVKVDTRSGQVSAFRVPMPEGFPRKAMAAHGIARDARGQLWFGHQDQPIQVDPATGTFKLFTPAVPAPLSEQLNHMATALGFGPEFGQALLMNYQITTDVDAKGYIWSDASSGAVRFDPAKNALTYYRSETPYWIDPPPAERFGFAFTYGVAGDADGNGWWTDPLQDRVQTADVKTGKVTEFVMRPPWAGAETAAASTAADRNYVINYLGNLKWHLIKSGVQYPRRVGADKHGNTVWVPNWWGQNLARIDIHTHEVTYLKPPFDMEPYFVTVGRDHVVWINLLNDDHIASYDPASQHWTLYRLPVNGCETRHIAVDDRTGDVWLPCYRASKLLRLQFPSHTSPSHTRR